MKTVILIVFAAIAAIELIMIFYSIYGKDKLLSSTIRTMIRDDWKRLSFLYACVAALLFSSSGFFGKFGNAISNVIALLLFLHLTYRLAEFLSSFYERIKK